MKETVHALRVDPGHVTVPGLGRYILKNLAELKYGLLQVGSYPHALSKCVQLAMRKLLVEGFRQALSFGHISDRLQDTRQPDRYRGAYCIPTCLQRCVSIFFLL
jgi:hypothetical protein